MSNILAKWYIYYLVNESVVVVLNDSMYLLILSFDLKFFSEHLSASKVKRFSIYTNININII